MLAQFLDMARCSAALQIGGRSAQQDPALRQLPGHHVRAQGIGDADGKVDALVDQADGLVRQQHVDADVGVELDELRDDIGQHRAPQGGAGGEAQPAARHATRFAHRQLYAFRHLQQLAAARQRLRAGIRQAQPAGGPVQQARAGPVLQFAQVARHDRARQAQFLCGGRLAAAGYRGNKHLHRNKLVHRFDRIWQQTIPLYSVFC